MSEAGGSIVLEVGRLGTLKPLGEGGQGRVWAASSVLINGSWPVAYKEYGREMAGEVDWSALRKMVDLTSSLPYQDGRELSERSAWPAAIVSRDGRPSGFLMRCLPAEFNAPMNLPAGVREVPAGVQFLLNSPEYLAARGLRVTDRFRIRLLEEIASALELFHRLDIAVGDLSPNNICFDPISANCFFLDCDGMSLHRRSPLVQVETPDWQVPPGENLATFQSDAYKFGLLVVRLFAGDQSIRDPRSVPGRFAQVRDLAARSLDAEPGIRPNMNDWLICLRAIQSVDSQVGEVRPAIVVDKAGRRVRDRYAIVSPHPRPGSASPQPAEGDLDLRWQYRIAAGVVVVLLLLTLIVLLLAQ